MHHLIREAVLVILMSESVTIVSGSVFTVTALLI